MPLLLRSEMFSGRALDHWGLPWVTLGFEHVCNLHLLTLAAVGHMLVTGLNVRSRWLVLRLFFAFHLSSEYLDPLVQARAVSPGYGASVSQPTPASLPPRW